MSRRDVHKVAEGSMWIPSQTFENCLFKIVQEGKIPAVWKEPIYKKGNKTDSGQ